MLKDIKPGASLYNTATPTPSPMLPPKDPQWNQQLKDKSNPLAVTPPAAPLSRRKHEKQCVSSPPSPGAVNAVTPLALQRYQRQQQSQRIQSPPRPVSMSPSHHRNSTISSFSTASLQTRANSSSSFSVNSSEPQLLLDQSHLKPGANAALLSYDRTIDMYRENAKKTNNPEYQCGFAIFLVEASKQQQQQKEDAIAKPMRDDPKEEVGDEDAAFAATTKDHPRRNSSSSYLAEAEKLLKQVAMRGHAESQYYLANMYASGLLHKTSSRKSEFDQAFPFFVRAAKHCHPDAAFRTARCYENGHGTRRDKAKAIQYYRKAAALNHPGAMYRLGLAEMNGELGMPRNPRDGHKWLKRSAESATSQYPHALHELAILHEKGVENIIFVDPAYAVDLYNEAAALGYAPAAFRLGECHEHGHLSCNVDPDMSVAYYNIAANQGHAEACFALTAWYLMGTRSLEPSESLAFTWAYRAATMGLPKAEYAVGYFCEVGIGIPQQDIEQAIHWYTLAAQKGEKRAVARLRQVPARYRGTPHSTDVSGGGASPPPAHVSKPKKLHSFILSLPPQRKTSSASPLSIMRSNSFFNRAKKSLLGISKEETPLPPPQVANFV